MFLGKILDLLISKIKGSDRVYELEIKRAIAWAQVDKALRIAESKYENTRIRIVYTDVDPVDRRPIELFAVLEIFHRDLLNLGDFLSPSDRNPVSRITLKVEIYEINNGKSLLTFSWSRSPHLLANRFEIESVIEEIEDDILDFIHSVKAYV